MRPARPAPILAARPGTVPGADSREDDVATDPGTDAHTSADALSGTLRRTEVQRGASSVPGREIVQVLTEIPEGAESGWHTHPGEEVGWIAAGTVVMSIRDRPDLTLHEGEGFLIPPRTPHNARDLGPGTGRMLSTYLVEIGAPLVTLVPEAPEP
jgi:quercetin dioxygenase-like cupin family protein